MTTLELIKKFLNTFFVERKPENNYDILTDDIYCFGFAENVEIESIEEARKLFESGKYHQFMDYALTFLREKQITGESAMVIYSLSHNGVTVQFRLTGHSRMTSEGRKLCFLNCCMENPNQMLTLFHDRALEQREKVARDVLNKAVPGGIMGGYNEPGFPLYFINDHMLRYLGYFSTEEFATDIHGLIENCFHPEDREMVDGAVAAQLAKDGTYAVDYRLRKKDGSYIWVHDIGRKIVAEDGREAIISVCNDITAEKEHDRFLQGIVSSLNGDLVLLAVDAQRKRTIPVYVSDKMGKQQGITKEEYLTRYEQNSMDSIYPGDHDRVWVSILDAIQNNTTPSISFRVLGQDGGAKWMNASFTRHGEQDGLPMLLVLFTESTIQNELQTHALNQNGVGIALIDADTKEIYYINHGLYQMFGLQEMDYIGKRCPDVLSGCGNGCGNCRMQNAAACDEIDDTACVNGKWLSVHAERKTWADKTVISIYAKDITSQHRLQEQQEETNRQLRQEQEMMQNACEFADLLTWVYDMPHDRIFPSARLQKEFGMPQVLNDYPEAWFATGCVQPEYVELHRQKVLAVKNGTTGKNLRLRFGTRTGCIGHASSSAVCREIPIWQLVALN